MPGLEEPVLSRLNRLDNILRELEDIRSVNHSPKSSFASTTSSGTLTSDGFPDFSTDSFEKHCRPIDEVVMEVEQKGTLIDRLVHAEDRILKLCLQLEEELNEESERHNHDEKTASPKSTNSPKKALKNFVRSCVKGKTTRTMVKAA